MSLARGFYIDEFGSPTRNFPLGNPSNPILVDRVEEMRFLTVGFTIGIADPGSGFRIDEFGKEPSQGSGVWTGRDRTRFTGVGFDLLALLLLDQGPAGPLIVTTAVVVPALAGNATVLTPSTVGATVAVLTPTVLANFFINPAPLNVTVGVLLPSVSNGAVPRLHTIRVQPRWEIRILRVSDGLAG